jgi:uncharacterized protein involved in outer membrane biogenesis
VKTALKVIGIVVVLLIVVAIALPFLINVNAFRPQIESNLSDALGRPVKVGNLSLTILTGSVGADQLAIADDPKFSQAPFIQAKSLKVGVELSPTSSSTSRRSRCFVTRQASGTSRPWAAETKLPLRNRRAHPAT